MVPPETSGSILKDNFRLPSVMIPGGAACFGGCDIHYRDHSLTVAAL